jgi:tRNA (uracil-5-)-methyltransferase
MIYLRSAQVNFHTTLSGQAMVTMIYHKKLGPDWQEAARKLRPVLGSCPSSSQPSVHIIGRSHKQKLELDASHVIETLSVDGRALTYKQVLPRMACANEIIACAAR